MGRERSEVKRGNLLRLRQVTLPFSQKGFFVDLSFCRYVPEAPRLRLALTFAVKLFGS